MSMSTILENVAELPDRPPASRATHRTVCSNHREVEKRRAMWKMLHKENPKAGVKALRKLKRGGATYAWLYRNDLQWLKAHKPKLKTSDAGLSSVDYDAWDNANVEFLEKCCHTMRLSTNRERLSRNRFIKQLPRANSVQKHLVNLPKTVTWLEANEESLEDYRLYRLRNAHQKLVEGHVEVKRWRLLRLAGIRYELISPAVEIEIRNMEKRT
jgi:hypothetical protein